MQITIKTKKGAVELSFRRLRLFRRVAALEARVEGLERLAQGLARPEKEASGGTSEPKDGGRIPVGMMATYVYTAWTEGEEAAEKLVAEHKRDAESRAVKGGDSA